MRVKTKDLEQMIIRKDSPIREALEMINQNEKGTLFVVDEDDKLCGVMTDGDVRRGLLRKITVDDRVTSVMNRSFVAFKQDTPFAVVSEKLGQKYKYIPLLDDGGKIVDYYSVSLLPAIPIARPFLAGNEAKYLMDCLSSNWISSQGKYVKRFEQEFSHYVDCKFGVCVTNGTVALHLALVSLGIGPGDEVIVPTLTFIATANAVTYTGAKPVFVDSEIETWNLDPNDIEKKISQHTKAIIAVHLYGQPAKMDEIVAIAKRHNLFVIEDAAQAHGALYRGRKIGCLGHIATFSFFGNKLMTTGEGGMVVTDDAKIYEKMLILRDHGMDPQKKYWHTMIGFNYRMTNMQAAIGCAQLERIEEILAKKNEVTHLYNCHLSPLKEVILPPKNGWSKNVNWLYSIVLKEGGSSGTRDQLMKFLSGAKIECRPFFYPIHFMPPYEDHHLKLKKAEFLSRNGLSLPSYTDIEMREVEYICQQILLFFKEAAS